MSERLRVLEVRCTNCGAINRIQYLIIRDEPVESEKDEFRTCEKETEKDATPELPKVCGHNCEDCVDVIRNPEVMKLIIAKYLASKLALPDDFVTQFRNQSQGNTVKLKDVLDALTSAQSAKP